MAGLGVGLIGTGYMGKCHALAWNSVASVFGDVERPRLIHLAEWNRELADDQAHKLGFKRATGNWRDLLLDPEVQVISITTPNALHAEMAIAALEAGKHVWCEKPMSPSFADAERMLAAAKASGRKAVLGYNYIQNPMVRHMAKLVKSGAIGQVHSFRVEMDEDFMADANAPFSWRSEAKSGYGVVDDFGVHPLSILSTMLEPVEAVFADLGKPYASRVTADGTARDVENFDVAHVVLRLTDGVSGAIQLSRAAWGRKGRIAIQLFGSDGTIAYDQERMNELQLFTRSGKPADQGFRTILAGPDHPPYNLFVPAAGHGLGFNDLKAIEAHELIRTIKSGQGHVIDFAKGLEIERAIHAMAKSHSDGRWVRLKD